MLRIFEKILTGIPDGISVPHGRHDDECTHGPITAQIGRLDRLFDPWTTPRRSCPGWPRGWRCDFPTLQGEPLWDEYQQRKVTSRSRRSTASAAARPG